MAKLNQLSKGYENFIISLLPKADNEIYSQSFTRAYFMVAAIPVIICLLFFNVVLNTMLNPNYPAMTIWALLMTCIILALSPVFLQITREILLSSIIINTSLLFALFASAYLSPEPLTNMYFYLPMAIIFGVVTSGHRVALYYLLSCFIFGTMMYQKFLNKLFSLDPQILSSGLKSISIDFPIICITSYAISSLYDIHMTKKLNRLKIEFQKTSKQQEFLSSSVRDKALGDMAGGIAHEINNPLFAISGSVEQALKDPSIARLNPRIISKLKRVKNHSDRIHSLIDKLLQFTSSDKPGDDISNVEFGIREALKLQQRSLKDHHIKVNVAGEAYDLQIDLFSLMKIINNLLINARQAIKDSSSKWIKIHISRDASYGYIDIIDSGHGIDRELEKKIFQPFFTTKEIGQGAGLGLSEALGLTKSFHGDLQYHLHDTNTCFRISLPIA